ncbi:hypothetical protein L9F63_015631, partial [Diploptera punctata]
IEHQTLYGVRIVIVMCNSRCHENFRNINLKSHNTFHYINKVLLLTREFQWRSEGLSMASLFDIVLAATVTKDFRAVGRGRCVIYINLEIPYIQF